MSVIAALAVALFGAASASPTATPKIYYPTSEHIEFSAEVSLVQLIATPERFDGKRVLIKAFVSLEFEGTAAYLHSDDFTHGLTANAIWLDVHPSRGKPRYMVLEGTFCATCGGHLGMFTGALTNVTRMSALDIRNPCAEQREEITNIERESASDYRTKRLERARTTLEAMGCTDEPAK